MFFGDDAVVADVVAGGALREPGGPGAVGAVDLGVHWHVVVARCEDPVVCVRQDWCEWLRRALPRAVEHLRLQLGELVLQLGEVVGKGLHDRRVDRAVKALVGGAQVLGTL